MAHGGKRDGAGRKPGAISRATRAAKKTFAEVARDLAPEALQVAAQIMRDETQTGSARMAAINVIMDRGLGKPMQAVHLSGPNGGPVATLDATKLSSDALREIMAAWADEATVTNEG